MSRNRIPANRPGTQQDSGSAAEVLTFSLLALVFAIASMGCTAPPAGDSAHPFEVSGNFPNAATVRAQRQGNDSPWHTTGGADRATTGRTARPPQEGPAFPSQPQPVNQQSDPFQPVAQVDTHPTREPDALDSLLPGSTGPAGQPNGPDLFSNPEDNDSDEPAGDASGENGAPVVALRRPQEAPPAGRIVLIDPGHGAHDPGGSGNGLVEKVLALSVSLRVATLLRTRGFTVRMTRTDDSYPTLPQRVRMADRHDAWVLLSIHANAFTRPQSRGVETLYPRRGRHARTSETFARMVQEEMASVTPTVDRGAKRDERNLYLMVHAVCPTALAEMGFMTNAEDADYLKNPGYLEAIARSLANGVIRYHDAD